jgi:very-short-patch-repair endonuclease
VDFIDEYEKLISSHQKLRAKSRLDRLENGLGHAEQKFLQNVWWPMHHHFENLHPEYEIRDYKEGYRYIDFAYILPYFRVAIEIDGLGPHWRNISKWQFSEQLQRQNSLSIDGWHVLRFTFDDVDEHPRLCQQTIQQLMGRWRDSTTSLQALSASEREIVRLTMLSASPITPKDVCDLLHVCNKHGQKLLHTLVQLRWLQPARGNVRITAYRLHPPKENIKM